MRPYEKLKTIYEIASRMIVRGEGAWKDYLSFAARIHKYSFDNALLVYAQNPDVTTLASIPQWNKVGRNVNRGSKGIAVCEYENAKLTLSYLFDISQTNGREIRFLDWQLDDDMKSEIATRLIRADELSATNFSETVTALASKRVNDNYENCLRSIMANSQDHIFSELPEGGLEAQLVSLLTDSTAYFVGKRCGLADDEIMLEGGMSTISDFNRIPLIATLGNTVTSCAKEILIEMELTIKTINAERTANNERKQSEYQLHGTERNIVPESASIQRADSRSAVGQIRQNGDGVPERKPPQSLYSFENGWHSDGSDAHGSADSHRENRGNDTGNAQKRTDAQHRGHDGTDTALEQPETVSRRNSNKGNRTDTEIKTENVVVTEPPKDGSVVVSEDDPKAKMSDDEIVKHYETILMSTDVYPIEMHRRLYLILKDEPDNSDWQNVSNEVYSIFAEYGNREYQGEVLYRTELVNKDGISMFFGDGSTYLPWIFVANIINAMIVDGDYPGDFTQLFEEARKILEKAEYVVSDEYLMTAVMELQKEKIYNPTALQIAEQTEAVIIRDAEDIEEEDFSAVVTAVEHSDDTEDVFAEPVEVQKKAERKPRAKQDLPSRNYRAFAKLFPDIISGKYSALMLSAGESFDPLEIYHKGGNRYSMEHYWINNGDRMYDPYMEFIIDRENQTIQAASYENSNVGLAQQVFTDEGYYPQLQKELNSFLSNWLKNISFQDYSPVRAIEIINDEEKTVTFPIEPETPQLNLFTDLTDGEQITMTDITSDDKKNVITEEPEIDENAEFKILEECTGSHHGQIDMIMTAYKGEIPVGYMQYSIFEDAPHINNIEVMPSQRRRGIATRLLQNLQGQYPTSEIVWGIMTDDGKALHDAITYSFDSEDYESVKRGLDEVNKGLAEFHQRIDEGESLNDDETAFMNDLSDIQYKLEKQLEELSPTHTFVRLPKAETAVEPIAEKPTQKPQNFRYAEGMELYPTGLKSKYKANIEAIKLLKAIEEDRRQATPDEQIILARYVGWGGLANAFNPKAKDWEKEYQELKLLLTDAEYKAAMDSTITAYYTEPELIKSIYTALDNFGFEGGKNRKLLDPAMGTGNFFSVLPEHLSDTKLYGVEIDSITGRIAKLLYPNANIENTGYETTKYEDNTFDVIIGNIPFNSIHIYDPRYKDNDFYIHDYFFAKSLDLAKPGGIIAFITSKGTLDKYDDSVRKYIASRAEFIGAIRLPNTAFKAVAGTEVTADIVFLKKREEPIEEWNLEDESWFDVTASMQTNWVRYNNYFIEHPEMLLGEMQHSRKMYGREDGTACVAPDDYNYNLNEKLRVAVGNLSAQFSAQPDKERKPTHTVAIDEAPEYENAPPGTKNFTFVVKDDNIYYCEKDKLIPQPHTGKKAERIKGLCSIRTALLDVINLQSGQYDESELKEKQKVLNDVYDAFVKKYGAIGSNANILVFSDDDQFPLLRSIENEIKNPDGTKTFEKAQIFYKATIHPRTIPTSADTAVEALYISLNTRLRVDLRYMSQLTGKQPIDVINELGDRIFLNPQRYSGNILDGWETAEEYLSGHVQDKLVYAEYYAEKEPDLFSRNVRALEEAQPVPLAPSDINAPVGAPWIPIEYYRQFMYETFDTPSEYRYESENDSEKECITLNYMEYTTVWRVLNKFYDRDSVKVYQTFGTHRKNAYEIFEDSLNQQITTVKDRVEYIDDEGNRKEKYVVNPKETRVARAKQAQIKEAFAAWLWKDAERKEDLLQIYNSRFNTVVPREYDGSHLIFPGMSEEMKLRPHQMNFAARVIYSGTGLAAHEVGAGKTAALIAAGMYLKNLGAIKKPVYVVPNPLVGQWATEFYRFFPNANILVSTVQDFTAQNRNRYVSRIAMGDYDAVILAHSQFERIPISAKRQIEQLEEQIVQISYAVGRIKAEKGENWTVKQMVTFKHNLEERLERLSALQKKDDLLTFEQLGIDFMFVDEAHMFKNCFVYTKMSRVAGINTSSSQRAFDMLNKCQYLQEINNGRGVVFATGTPISNSMTEMFVMMRYLEPDELKRQGLSDFDSWAATYGEVVSSLEITPEGGGYRMRQRFAKFHNLPELMRTYRLVADVQTAEMLNLPRPEIYGGKKEIISSTPTEHQKKIMATFIERAEAIRNGQVKPYEDNMLKLTNEARQMAIDPRLIDRSAPNDPNSKLNVCIDQIYKVWKETEADRLTQLVFCDVSTPAQKPIIQMEQVDGVYKAIPNQFTNVYDEIKKVLMERGVPESEIVFIHDAKTEVQRQAIFEKTRKGEIRVLLGSTGKLGTGVNVQDRVIALHHLDVPWKPSDITQRDGRGLRQGNMNKATAIYNSFNKPTQITDKNGNITYYTYDTNGNVTKITYPQNGESVVEETYAYNNRNQVTQHTDLRGTVTVYTYNDNGLLVSKKVGDRNAIQYSYTNGFLTSETDARNNTTQYAYNAFGLPSIITDSANKQTSYEYDLCGNLLVTTDANGKSVINTYDANYNKIASTDANGNKTWYSYNGNMKPNIVTLPDGSTIEYKYDSEDRPIKVTDQNGNVTTTEYDDAGKVISVQDADKNSVYYEYDSVGNVLKEIGKTGAETTKTYDAAGNVLTVTDDNGNTTTYQYDNMNRVIKVTDALSGVTTHTYNNAGDLLSSTNALGYTVSYTYDAYGNKLTETDARGNTTTYTYDANSNLLTVKDALNNVTTYAYDSRNLLVSVTNSKNQTVTYGYDALGRQISVTDAKNNTVYTAYDGAGNVITVTDAKGNVISTTTYNELNLAETVTDAAGNTTTYQYNNIGKPEIVTDSLGNRQQYWYDNSGNNIKVMDAEDNVSTATYDALGNVTSLTGPLNGSTQYTYDTLGRLISETTSSGGTVNYGYNALNLKTQLTNAKGQVRTYTYDSIGRITGYTSVEGSASYTYDNNGNVLTATDQNGTVTREYDALNRVTRYTDTLGNVIRYEYDTVGNLTKIIYPDNTAVTYAYDANNNLVSVTDWANRVTTYSYDENNNVIGVTKPDGSITTTVYDNAQRVVSTVERNSANIVIVGYEYTYDTLGRILSEIHLAENIKYEYNYDKLSRVTKRTVTNLSDNTVSEETYAYDAAGNITSCTVSDGTNTFVYDQNNRLTSYNGQAVTYDMDGNMLSATLNGAQMSFVYDSANRLISAGGNTYTYNVEDVRVRNLCGESETTYAYNTNGRLSQLLVKTTDGVVTKYVYGLGLIGEETAGTFKTYHFDYRGSTTAITDINGNVTDTFTYDTYGNLISRTGTSVVIFLYNGRDGVVTDDNGLIYMRARYYSPELRRFINADIIAGEISNAVTLNRYAYANGNPVSNIDPFGLSAERGNSPTPLEAAYMARHAYDAKTSQYNLSLGDEFGGWKLNYIYDPYFKDIGLKICVYSKKVNEKNAYSVVYVGTNMDFTKDEPNENVFVNVIDAISDWYNNITQPIAASPDMLNSIMFAKNFANEHKDCEITFIGHSKGGAEAAAAAVATNKNALLFNPATVNLFGYGLSGGNYSAEMTAYIVDGEILNNIFGWMSTPIGDMQPLYSKESGAINKHSMDAVIEALS